MWHSYLRAPGAASAAVMPALQGLDELLSSMINGPEDPPLTTSTLTDEDAEDDHHHHQHSSSHQQQQPNGDTGSAAAAAALNEEGPAGLSAGSSRDAGAVASSHGGSGASAAAVQRVKTAPGGEVLLQQLQQPQQASADLNLQQQQHVQEEQPLVKVVLARRTSIPWEDSSSSSSSPQQQQHQQLQRGWQRRSGPVLLQALQERDPRAYQLLLSTPPGATFLACTPERLYVRSGRLVASEAVAGTRPRGPPGDLEADFYQGLDLLQSPKDHAEFTLVRDWIRQQLAPLCVELKTGGLSSAPANAQKISLLEPSCSFHT